MAITYHAGRRIQGLEYVTQTATLTNAEDSGSWTGSGSLSITSGELQVRLGGSNAGVAQRDITSVNSSSWVMRWKWEQTGTQTNASPNDMRCMIGLASNAGSFGGNSPTYGSTSGDHIGMYMDVGHIHFVAFNGTTPSAQSTSSSMINFTGAPFTKYCEIIRDGSSFTLNIFDSSTFTGTKLTRSLTYTGMTSLRYIGGQAGWYGGGGGIQANMSEITFYDGITSATPTGDVKPTNVQAGSRFEETDTRKMYHYNEATLTLSLGQTVMSSSPQFNYHAVDIPSASDFIMNFDWTLTGNRDTPYVTLSSDTTAYGDPASGQKKFIMMYANNNGDLRLGARYNDGGASENDLTGTGTDLASNVKSYFQLIKSGSSLNYSRYGSASDRTSQTNALQSIATYTLPSTYTSTADFSYLGLGAYSSNGQNTIHEVKLYVGVSSTDTAWTEEGT